MTVLGSLLRRAAAVVAVVCVLLGGRWAVAHAHAALVRAEPRAGSVLASSPARVRLVFSEPLEPALARLTLARLTLAREAGADAPGVEAPLPAAGDPHDVYALVAPLEVLAPGAYRVRWRVVSADGHAVEGTLAFRVAGTAPPAPTVVSSARAPSAPAPRPPVDTVAASGLSVAGAPLAPATLRGLALGSLMALAGLLGFLALPRAPGALTPRRAARLAAVLAVAAPVLLALHAAAWLAAIAPDGRLTAEWVSTALGTRVGQVEAWRVGLAALALWALALARRPGLALAFTAAALGVSGAAGHSGAIHAAWATPVKAVHLLASAAWLGGVLWLVVRERGDVPGFAREASRVSAVALPATLLVLVSGVALTLLFLPEPAAVLHSSYGTLVLLKGAGLLALVAFGAYYRSRVLSRLPDADGAAPARSGFVRTLRVETAVMSSVVLLGGLLAYVPPPRGAPVSVPHQVPP